MTGASITVAASAPQRVASSRQAVCGTPVARSAALRTQRCSTVARASAERKVELPAAVTVAVGAALASPLAAQAAVTPSLKNLINSVIAGGVVLAVIAAAVTAVSGFDPIARK